MTTLQELVALAYKNQDTLNKKLNPDWATQNWPYYRAVWTEAGEAAQHIKSWFWWKENQFGKQMTDEAINHVRMELVDVLHFGLSMDLVEALRHPHPAVVIEELSESMVAAFTHVLHEGEIRNAETLVLGLEKLVEEAIENREFSLGAFSHACLCVGMDLEATLEMYFAKTALNKFRYSHGYDLPKKHPDAYVKMWGGNQRQVEDNVFLQEIVDGLDGEGIGLASVGLDRFQEMVYQNLSYHYPGNAISMSRMP